MFYCRSAVLWQMFIQFYLFFFFTNDKKKHFDKKVEMSSIRKYIYQDKILLLSNLILRSESGSYVSCSQSGSLCFSIPFVRPYQHYRWYPKYVNPFISSARTTIFYTAICPRHFWISLQVRINMIIIFHFKP